MGHAGGNTSNTRPATKALGRECDDRGTTLAPIDVSEFVQSGSTPEESLRRERLVRWLCSLRVTRRVRHNLKPTWEDLALVALGCAVVVVLKVKGWFLQNLGWMATGGLSAFACVATYFAGLMRLGDPVKHLHPIAAPSLTAEGFCGQCGYSLRDLPAQDDGCVVCPECGAAWSKQRITWPWWSAPEYVKRVAPKNRSLRLLTNTGCPSVADHFGKLVPLLALGEMLTLKEQSSDDSMANWNRIERELREIGRLARIATAAVALAVFGAVAYWFSTIQALDPPAKVILIVIAVFLGVGIALVVPRSDMYISRAGTLRVLTKHKLCPSCGQQLTRVVADEHVVACSHCGSTWLLPAAIKS